MPTGFEKHGHTLITLAAIIAAFVGLVTMHGKRLDVHDKSVDGHDRRLDRLTGEVSGLRRFTVGSASASLTAKVKSTSSGSNFALPTRPHVEPACASLPN